MILRSATVAAAALAATSLGGCELLETCDPELDPNCTIIDADVGDTDTGGSDTGTGCATLGEGQSRCIDSNNMEICQNGTQTTQACTGVCSGNACTDAIQYVRIYDATGSLSGQHPGADIDAIALESNGQTFYATRVTDSFIDPSVTPNLAPNPTECVGPPDVSPGQCDLSDGAEHWVSLAGGQIVVTFGRPIVSGDQITVYECAGAAQDSFDVEIGASARLEGDWEPLLTDSTGTISVRVP